MLRSTIKPEVRVLAVSSLTLSKSPFHALFLFVVLRGRLWIEGVFTVGAKGDSTLTLAKAIVESRYYKELRFVVLDNALLKPPFSVDPARVATISGLPTLTVLPESTAKVMASASTPMLKLPIKSGKPAYVAYWGTSEEQASALIKLVRVGITLEPLRILRLLKRAFAALKPHLKGY